MNYFEDQSPLFLDRKSQQAVEKLLFLALTVTLA